MKTKKVVKKLPVFLQPCLPSYYLNQLNIKKDKKLIITAILNNGDFKALKWLSIVYSEKEIKNMVKKPTRGLWYKDILQYWLKIFNLNLPKTLYHKAIIKF